VTIYKFDADTQLCTKDTIKQIQIHTESTEINIMVNGFSELRKISCKMVVCMCVCVCVCM